MSTKVNDYQSAMAEILKIKKGLKTAKANLVQFKKDEADDADIQKQESTIKSFKTKLKDAEENAKEFRPGFFKRTSTWVVFGIITLTAGAAAAAYAYTRVSTDEDAETPDGNGDTI